MAASDPVLQVKLTGEENVTQLNQSETWSLSEKVELDYSLTASDGEQTLDYSHIDTVRTIVIYGTGDYYINVTVGSNTEIAFESQDFFVLSPSAAFAATITAITISTDESVAITVKVRIYGE